MKDIFGKALLGYLSKDHSKHHIIERDDGYHKSCETGIYFARYPQWDLFEKDILFSVFGRALDVGAGAGRHSLELQSFGLEVHAIDISPGAIEVMRKRRVRNIHLMDLRKLDFPENYFDSVLMMFNNFGLAGSAEGTKKFLEVLYKKTTPDGMIIAVTRNPYRTTKPEHLAYHQKNRIAGKPAGLLKLRIEYESEKGDWFGLLIVSLNELKTLIENTGWKIHRITRERNDGMYGFVLKK